MKLPTAAPIYWNAAAAASWIALFSLQFRSILHLFGVFNPFQETTLLAVGGAHLVLWTLLGSLHLSLSALRRVVVLWTALGAVAAALPSIIGRTSLLVLSLYTPLMFFSASFCVIPLISAALDASPEERRALDMALIFAAACIINILVSMFMDAFPYTQSLLILALLRASVIPFALLLPKQLLPSRREAERLPPRTTLIAIFGLLTCFFLSDWLVHQTLPLYYGVYIAKHISIYRVTGIEVVAGIPAALIAGVLADRLGRKPIVASAIVLLGAAHMLEALKPMPVEVYAVINGVCWGAIVVLLLATIWGDYSFPRREVFLGSALSIYIVTNTLKVISVVSAIRLPLQATFSSTGILMLFSLWFVAMMAEPLPERILEQRRLRSYIAKAKKIAEHYEKRGDKPSRGKKSR